MISTGKVMRLLDECYELAEQLNNLDEENIESWNKARSKAKAEVSQNLLYLAHLCDVARMEALNEYHKFKGRPVPEADAPELTG